MAQKIKFRTPYDKSNHAHPKLKMFKASKTHQSFKDECDINNIMGKYAKGLAVTHVNRGIPEFGDVSQFGQYSDALQILSHAQELFDALPSAARRRFDNDPQKMATFLANPKNAEEAIKLGLMEKRKPDPKQTDITEAAPQAPTTPGTSTQTNQPQNVNPDKK